MSATTRTFAFVYVTRDDFTPRRIFVTARSPRAAQAWVQERLGTSTILKVEEV